MPTVAEQDSFRTRDVPLPVTSYHCGSMIHGMSVVVDVVQGAAHPHATALRQFCGTDWRHIVAVLEQSSVLLVEGNVLPRICREVQSLAGVYYQRVLAGEVVPPPNYHAITEKILHGQFNMLLPLPVDLQLPRGDAATEPSPAPAPAPAASRSRDPGALVTNAAPVTAWTEAYAASGFRLQQIRRHAPTTTVAGGAAVELCLSYHLRGTCYSNCERRATHRPLKPGERTAMSNFVANYVAQPAANQQASSGQGGTGPGG